MAQKIRIAFVKFGGLSAGGTERWLQLMAANLPRDLFEVDYFYCDAAPYIGSDYKHADTDPSRLQYMQDAGVHLIKFKVGKKDVTKPTHDWVDTNFWELFDASQYDLVQTAKAGPAEYPYHLMKIPVVEYITLSAGVDSSPNIAWSIHLSQWQRAQWYRAGGALKRSSIIPIPVLPPASSENLRAALGIPANALVAGFHQRNTEEIFSPIPLEAFAQNFTADRHFVIMGGAQKYREQVQQLNLRNVHFVDHAGDASKISEFLNTLDIFAHGRRDGETFGTVFAEAMIHGKPCLSHYSDIGANAQPETMGPAGLFALDAADYAKKLGQLFDDAKLRGQLASKARTHAEMYYSLPACVRELGCVYKRLCNVPSAELDESSQRIPYGVSPLGYLQAGDLENQASIAFHMVQGFIPEEFDVHLVKYFLPRVKVFFDVGANIGLYSLVAAHDCALDARIFAFEPQPECCRALRQTISLNNWENRLTLLPVGVSDAPDKLTLHLTGTGSSFDNSFNDNAVLPTVEIDVDSLDNIVKQQSIERVDFIKIDVEGFEQRVLEGADGIIKKFHPVLFIEIADRIRGRQYRNPNYARTLQWLQERGYKTFRSTEDCWLKEVGPEEEQEHLAMYLCLHQEAHAADIPKMAPYAKEFRRKKQQENPQGVHLFLRRAKTALRHPGRVYYKIRNKIAARLA